VKTIFNNKRKTKIAIVAFLTLLFVWFCTEDSYADSRTLTEFGVAGPNHKFDRGYSLYVTQRWNNKWNVGLGLLSEMEYYDQTVSNNMVLFGQRLVYGPGIFKDVGLGIGVAYLGNTSVTNGSHLNYMLSMEYFKIRKGIIPDYIVYRHMSNAGTKRPNPGIDAISIGYAFGK